uniref:SPATA21 n=1 Tax=Steinernema glaseri TaxID=37863 RepID=A0A1I7ZY07_9BILA
MWTIALISPAQYKWFLSPAIGQPLEEGSLCDVEAQGEQGLIGSLPEDPSRILVFQRILAGLSLFFLMDIKEQDLTTTMDWLGPQEHTARASAATTTGDLSLGTDHTDRTRNMAKTVAREEGNLQRPAEECLWAGKSHFLEEPNEWFPEDLCTALHGGGSSGSESGKLEQGTAFQKCNARLKLDYHRRHYRRTPTTRTIPIRLLNIRSSTVSKSRSLGQEGLQKTVIFDKRQFDLATLLFIVLPGVFSGAGHEADCHLRTLGSKSVLLPGVFSGASHEADCHLRTLGSTSVRQTLQRSAHFDDLAIAESFSVKTDVFLAPSGYPLKSSWAEQGHA